MKLASFLQIPLSRAGQPTLGLFFQISNSRNPSSQKFAISSLPLRKNWLRSGFSWHPPNWVRFFKTQLRPFHPAISSLPLHHKDPFDRLLIAQAQTEGITIATTDLTFNQYASAPILWASNSPLHPTTASSSATHEVSGWSTRPKSKSNTVPSQTPNRIAPSARPPRTLLLQRIEPLLTYSGERDQCL